MDKQVILKEILKNENLKTKYWPEIDAEKENLNTLLMNQNKYIKALNSILNSGNPKIRMNELFNIFKIQ